MFVTSPHNIDKAFPIHCRDVPWAIILRVTDTKNEQVDNSCQVERKLQRSMISLLSRPNARAGLEEGVNDIQPPADLIDAEEGTSLPQKPGVVVDVADIGLHSRLASECRNNICCRLYSFWSRPIDYVLVYAVEPEVRKNPLVRKFIERKNWVFFL